MIAALRDSRLAACNGLVAVACLVHAMPAPAVTVAIIPFPGGLANEDGTGLFPTLLAESYAGQPDYRGQLYPAKRAFQKYDNGEVNVLVSVPVCRWRDSHFLTLGLRDYELFLARAGQYLPKPGDELAAKTIAVVAGYTHPLRNRHPEWKWHETRDYELAIQMLIIGRVDYVYGYAFLMDRSVARLKQEKAVHYDAKRVFDNTIPAIAFHGNANGLAEAKTLQASLTAMVALGRYLRLMQSYHFPDWYYSDGLAGKITITAQNECSAGR